MHQPSCMIPDDPSVASYDHLPSNTHAFARRLEKFARLCADVPAASTRTSPEARARSISTRVGPTRPRDAATASSSASSATLATVSSSSAPLGCLAVSSREAESSAPSAAASASSATSDVFSSAPPRTASTRVQSSRVIEPVPSEGTSFSPSACTSTPRTRHTCRLSASVATGSAEPLEASPGAFDISASPSSRLPRVPRSGQASVRVSSRAIPRLRTEDARERAR